MGNPASFFSGLAPEVAVRPECAPRSYRLASGDRASVPLSPRMISVSSAGLSLRPSAAVILSSCPSCSTIKISERLRCVRGEKTWLRPPLFRVSSVRKRRRMGHGRSLQPRSSRLQSGGRSLRQPPVCAQCSMAPAGSPSPKPFVNVCPQRTNDGRPL